MATVSLARPAPASPCIRFDPTTSPLVRLRHPGYGTLPNNVLLTLPAVDSAVKPPTPQSASESQSDLRRYGLHHRTALTAGAIVSNNAFGRVYLSHDQAATQPVQVPLDGLLDPGSYWLQLRGYEPPAAGLDAVDDGQGMPVLSSGSLAMEVSSVYTYKYRQTQISCRHRHDRSPRPPPPPTTSHIPSCHPLETGYSLITSSRPTGKPPINHPAPQPPADSPTRPQGPRRAKYKTVAT